MCLYIHVHVIHTHVYLQYNMTSFRYIFVSGFRQQVSHGLISTGRYIATVTAGRYVIKDVTSASSSTKKHKTSECT